MATYLVEHLSGADAAIHVVERLRRTQEAADDRRFFDSLFHEFRNDRDVVRQLLTTIGATSSSPKRFASRAMGSLVKRAAGGSPGTLSLFRTLEGLSIGIQGKRCMWRALQAVPSLASPDVGSFSDLEAAALRQWYAVEERRRRLVPDTFGAVRTPRQAPRR